MTTVISIRLPEDLRARLQREAKRRAARYRRPNFTATLVELLAAALDQAEGVRK